MCFLEVVDHVNWRNLLPLFLFLKQGLCSRRVNISARNSSLKAFSVRSNQIYARQLTHIMSNLAELYEWELDNLPLLRTLTGRHLYFGLARRAVCERELLSGALKEIMGGAEFTDKALRIRLYEMQQAGLIESVRGTHDARSRHLIPTDKFHEMIHTYTNQVHLIFNRNFLMIEK